MWSKFDRALKWMKTLQLQFPRSFKMDKMTLLLLFAFLLVTNVAAGSPIHDLGRQLRCPYADLWLKHGPERATAMLGLGNDMAPVTHRRLQQSSDASVVWGSCTYKNPFAGQVRQIHSFISFLSSMWHHHPTPVPGWCWTWMDPPGLFSPGIFSAAKSTFVLYIVLVK